KRRPPDRRGGASLLVVPSHPGRGEFIAMRRDQIEELFYGKPEQQRRFTQDFPILPDVWIEYGKTPDKRVELLLTPHNESDAASLARALRDRLQTDSTPG